MDENTNCGFLENVTKSFGEVVAISDVSFSIKKGSIMGFLGPNGSGKTTSIKLLLGLTKPQTGNVQLLGKDPFTSTDLKQNVGYVPERDCFYKFLTANDYLVALGRYYMPKSIAEKRSLEVLEELDLLESKNKKITNFSKGMKQRIKIGQSLMHNPKLIIADEPFNGLDPIIRKSLFDLFEQYRNENGTTFFLSSHILFEIERLATQIIILYKGRTIAEGNPHKIRELIQEQPHSISITTSKIQEFAKLLIENNDKSNKLISSMQFSNSEVELEKKLEVLTHSPKEFYSLVTDLVVDNNIVIKEIKATDEGLENLFKSLTVG